jgi:periplasmic protein CpxP/Spy
MGMMKHTSIRSIVLIAGVAVMAAAIGLATTAQLAARNSRGGGQDPVGPGGGRGAGMMGQERMGPGGPGRGGPGGPFGMAGLPLRELDLTDAQRQQVRTIMESHRDEQKAIGDRMRTARQALQNAIAADAFDEAAIRAKAAEVAAVDADAAVLQAKVRAAVAAILTPEQAKKAKELRTEMENRMKEGRGGRMRPHPASAPEPRAEGDLNLPETV